MKISPVLNNNFQGLWRKKVQHKIKGTNKHEYIYHYYPFKDETEKEICRNVENVYFRTYYAAAKTNSTPGYELGEIIEIGKAHKPLDITKEERQDFLKTHKDFCENKPVRIG